MLSFFGDCVGHLQTFFILRKLRMQTDTIWRANSLFIINILSLNARFCDKVNWQASSTLVYVFPGKRVEYRHFREPNITEFLKSFSIRFNKAGGTRTFTNLRSFCGAGTVN